MKVNELMIGDWVLCNGAPIQLNIAQIHNLVCDTRWAHVHKCEPIHLSADILKANGFEESCTENLNRRFYHSKLVGITLNLVSYTTTIMGKLVIISYVHELQHALRLCGLNEFADKFKLENKPSEKSEGTVTENKDK